jgi:serralysin
VALAGSAEKTLITHFYEAILRRAPDGGGKAFWQSEALRMQSDGADPNEAWYAMSVFFFNGTEYASLNRDNPGFVSDLYMTFFNRAADGGGLQFWVDQLNGGMPREVVLAGFLFSPEFQAFTQGIFGNTAARAEINVVMDFYRGALARLPDDGGLSFWVSQFRVAQCKGAGDVYASADSISAQFFSGPEYSGRNRSNAQYVGDLYNAFLRRGGDPGGVQFWINQINTGAQTRDQVRQAFLGSPEFGNRVNAIVQQGCVR